MRVRGTLEVKASVKLGSLHLTMLTDRQRDRQTDRHRQTDRQTQVKSLSAVIFLAHVKAPGQVQPYGLEAMQQQRGQSKPVG